MPAPGPAAPQRTALPSFSPEPNQQSRIDVAPITDDAGDRFLRDSRLSANVRLYLLDRDRDENPDNVGTALGGSVSWVSGWLADRLQVRATVYTSQVLHGPADRDGTQLFKPGPEGFTVLGEANATIRFGENSGIRVGRQLFELPYLGSHDIRMVPNTFEAIAIGKVSKSGFAWQGGYVSGIKRKNSDEFISMAEAAGVEGSKGGVAFLGGQFRFPDGTLVGAINQHSFDIFNTFFVKAEKTLPIDEEKSINASIQFTDQRSVGKELIGGFKTFLIATRLEASLGQAKLRAGLSMTGNSRGIQKPYGNPANYLSVIVEDFDRAGEVAYMLGGNYDIGKVGPGLLSMFVNYVHGDTPDVGDNASADQTEYDGTIDYRVNSGWANGAWFRIRGAYVKQDSNFPGADDFFDFRIIVNYPFAIF